MQQNADMFRLRVVAQLRELSCKPCFAHVLRKTPTSRKNSASAALTTIWEGGPKRPHLPNSHSSQQPEEARFAPCRSPVRHLKIIRAAVCAINNPTPDFHNAMSTSCLVLSCLVLSCLVLSCLVLSCLVLSCLVLSCLVLSCLVLSCLVLSCLVLSCLVLSCLVLSCLVLSCLVLSVLVLSCLCVHSACLFAHKGSGSYVHFCPRPCPSTCRWARLATQRLRALMPTLAA